MGTIFDILDSDHREVEKMLAQFESMIGPAGQPTGTLSANGGALADTLISNESQHEAAEEQVFWPAVKEKVSGGEQLAGHAIEQESEAKQVLASLDGMSPENGQFIPLVQEFIHAARQHVAYEENQVWPKLREVLSADEQHQLGEKFAAARKAGPTRPHPHTPPNPAVLKTAGMAAAATDKLRDKLSSRQN